MPAFALLGLLGIGAVAGLLRASLFPEPGMGATLTAWRRVLADDRFHDALLFTLAIALVSTLAALPIAVLVARMLRHRRLAQALFSLPVLLPHLLVGALAVAWLGPGGLADRLLGTLPIQFVRSPTGLGIVLVYLVKEVPFLALLVLAVWDDELDRLEEAAAAAGASPRQRLWHVIVPVLARPLTVGAVAVAAFVIGSFEVPLLVGPSAPSTLAVHALDATRIGGLAGRAEAAAVLLVATVLATLIAAAAMRWPRRD
ncbi:MAG: ABC transporter permease subunit [Nitriliruptorales bacterium]|nr:ABC transporter permease subunit [Nitriliruptorales bacterium]